MGAWPQDEAQAASLVSYGGTLAAISGASSVTTKTLHEAFGIPTPKINADGLRMTRMAIYLARNIKLDSMPEFQNEVNLIKSEVRPIVNKVLEMGDGDVALGSVRAFEAGILDIPWSPNKWVKSKVMPARDVDGCLRILDPGNMPFPKEVLEFHEEKLRLRAEKEKQPYDLNLAVSSVYEMSESMQTLLSDKW
jgi:methylaspartate mutase epsilon subunit